VHFGGGDPITGEGDYSMQKVSRNASAVRWKSQRSGPKKGRGLLGNKGQGWDSGNNVSLTESKAI